MTYQEVSGVSGLSHEPAATASLAEYAYAQQLVQAYFAMLTVGCQAEACTNALCRSNAQTPVLTATEAAIKSVYLATQAPVAMCVAIGRQQEQVLVNSVQHQEQEVFEATHEEESDDLKAEERPDATEDVSKPKEELQPETADTEELGNQQPESKSTIELTATSSEANRSSTPRRRLSTAVQLDLGLNKKPTTIIRVAVQPKHPPVVNQPTASRAASPESPAAPEQQQNPPTTPPTNSTKDARQRRLSRPKQKLLDAIKKSFSRTRKAPLGST
ncbi:hypothetical protein BBJ28_00005237 [Nothophytophthora sp. Chile5]|nr:hypothetical protein BBJ28_00005237 [Nothophytophthora sp. Chile5]